MDNEILIVSHWEQNFLVAGELSEHALTSNLVI